MTDKQTLQWWIDHAKGLEAQLRESRTYARARDERIIDSVIERNVAYSKERMWYTIAKAFVEACEVDGFGDVHDIHLGEATKALKMYQEEIPPPPAIPREQSVS